MAELINWTIFKGFIIKIFAGAMFYYFMFSKKYRFKRKKLI